MPRLTQSDRDRLRRQLLDALVPPDIATTHRLRDAAFRAVIADYYTPAGLKKLAALPQDWLPTVDLIYARPTGEQNFRPLRGPETRLPRTPPQDHPLGAAAQAAVDAWHAHVTADVKRRNHATHRIDTVLDASATLDGLLTRLPEARAILKLPPAADVAASAAELNAALAARPTAKPARKR